MGLRRMLFAAGIFVALFSFIRCDSGPTYRTYIINQSCNGNVTLPCPVVAMNTIKAGTLRFSAVPVQNCNLTVTLDKNCGNRYDKYAIYLNIRKSNLPPADRIVLLGYRLDSPIFLKNLTGQQNASGSPKSIGQVLTPYVRRPAITMQYLRGNVPSNATHEAIFDYVILESNVTRYNNFCIALSGYVDKQYICDTDWPSDRINCPKIFSASIGSNPATARQCNNTGVNSTVGVRNTTVKLRSTRMITRTTTKRKAINTDSGIGHTNNNYANSDQTTVLHHDSKLSAGDTAGIVIGVLVFMVCVISAVAVQRRRRSGLTYSYLG